MDKALNDRLNSPRPISAVKLLAADLPPLEYLVPGILPEGFGVVAGAPKVGKSILAGQVCVEIAEGGELLGRKCERRPVLYLALEDGPRRIQERLRKFARGRELRNLGIRLRAPRIEDGLAEELAEWFARHDGGLVYIDVLTRVSFKGSKSRNVYDGEYESMALFHELALVNPGSALVINTHDRKAASQDFLTTVTGTRAVTGSADWIWVVKRPQLDPLGEMYITGRDIRRDMLLGLHFDGEWTLDERRPLPGASSERNDIYKWLAENGPAFAKAVADALGMSSRQATQNLLTKMHEAGDIRKTPDGYEVDLDMGTVRSWAADLRREGRS